MSSDESGSDVEDVHALAINEHFAKALEYKNEREELAKLKAKYGSDGEDTEDSEEAESEDEDGEELTPAVDVAILRTLARIKRKDPDIYQSEKGIFEEEQKRTANAEPVQSSRARREKDKSKPLTIRQAALDSALRASSRSRSGSPEPLPHAEEQRALRSETIAVFREAARDEDENENEDDLFVPREKTKDEQERQEEEYRDYLAREVGEDLEKLVVIEEGVGAREDEGTREEVVSGNGSEDERRHKKEKRKKKKKQQDPDAGKGKEQTRETDQEFLMNYILNRGWIDRSVNRVPTYKEVVATTSRGAAAHDSGSDKNDNDLLSGDEDFDELADRFETSYNFRFEEPDADTIKSYPRNLPSLVRREDTTRKDARERRKARKEAELLKKKEEVKRLKALKLKDLRSKLEQIGKEGGRDLDKDIALQQLDLDGDWDPEAHDAQMAGLYGDEEIDEDGKPEWEDDIDIGDIYMSDGEGPFASSSKPSKKDKKKKNKKAADEEEDGVDVDAMDADVPRNEDEEEWDGTEEMRKRKLNEYMEEIYGLDFNDMVGDMPTRFKYTSVPAQSFALTPAEILMATDQELNQYLSVKKYAPYRKDGKWDRMRGERLKELKQSVAPRVDETWGDGANGTSNEGRGEVVKKRKGKKERMKLKAAEVEMPSTGKRKVGEEQKDALGSVATEEPEKKRRRRHKKAATVHE